MDDTRRAMTADEQSVWTHIKKCVGKENAIQRMTLIALTALNDRLVRACIESLRKEHGKLICYSTGQPGGYFIATSVEELQTCRNLEASREAHVRENRQFYDRALSAVVDGQLNFVMG